MERERIGPYRIVATAAVDRLTITYRAQRSSREPMVLIEAIKPGVTRTAPVARALEREAERLRALRHPLWPTLIEVIPEPDGPALVLVDQGGHRLNALLERLPRVDPEAACAIAIEVARAAAAMHMAGSAHGALRPGLVELTSYGGVCLHAHLASPDLPNELASPEDMAPEQIVGEPADAKSDVFVVGVLLYRMLTGQPPFEGDEEGISQRIRHHPPAPIHRLAPDVPAAIERVVLRCLAKRRHDRFPDMASVAAFLTRALRRQTSLPTEHLIARALGRAGLADPLPPPLDRDAALGTGVTRGFLRRYAVPVAFGVAAVAVALLAWQNLREAPAADVGGPRGILDQPAHLRVLARPWAEVYLDGKLVDVTPMGFPLDVPAGRHTVVLRHPGAPDEARNIEIIAGQTILLDVDMNVRRPVDAGSPAPSAEADEDADTP